MIYLGIDWGEKRIGLAIGSEDIGVATPYGVVGDVPDIKNVIEHEDVGYIVVGDPVKMSGSHKNKTKGFQDFLDRLILETHLPVDLIDERLTSKAADKLARHKGGPKSLKKARKASAERDAVAAMLILQNFFDKMG